MKRKTHKILRLQNLLIAGVGSLIGINFGCERFIQVEYGCPTADFYLKGKVQDPSGNPVEGIEVMHSYASDTTGSDGRYELPPHSDFPMGTLHLDIRDVDGEEHGSFRDTIIEVPINSSDFQGGDGNWYEGKLTKTIDVTVTPTHTKQ